MENNRLQKENAMKITYFINVRSKVCESMSLEQFIERTRNGTWQRITEEYRQALADSGGDGVFVDRVFIRPADVACISIQKGLPAVAQRFCQCIAPAAVISHAGQGVDFYGWID